MKRFFKRIGRFFWSWGFLKFVLWAVTLIVLFYVEEDWRGAHMWEQTQAKWEERGESFDYSRLIPPPIPDSENLGALPLFKLEPDPQSGGQPGPVALRKALHYADGLSISVHTKWQTKGSPSDLNAMRSDIAAAYFKVFQTAPTNPDARAQLEAIFPFIAEINAASATRPYCRFDCDYTSQPPYMREMRSLTLQLSVAKFFSVHAVLALAEHQPGLALSDIETELKLASGVNDQPIFIAGLVSVAQAAVIETAIFEGLSKHSWNDAQLAQLESDLQRFDFLTTYQFNFRGELAGVSLPNLEYFQKARPNIMNLIFGISDSASSPVFYDRNTAFQLWPGGWFDQNKSRITDGLLQALSLVDPKTHRAFAGPAEQELRQANALEKSWRASLPWRVFASLAVSQLLRFPPAFARAQVWLDETRIALALERYHLAHGVYPATLDELAPSYIAEVSHDVINGDPYRYRLRPGGTFLLYSVGWNEKDEGGLVAAPVSNPQDPDDRTDKHGDWVWPTPR